MARLSPIFCCVHEKLIVELDGQVHFNLGAQEYDYQRTEYLKSEGYQVLRFENKQVFEFPDLVLHHINLYFEEYQAKHGAE